MARSVISPRTPTRYPRFGYRGTRLWPHDRNDGPGELILDALSGNYFPLVYAVDGPYGPIDGRNGAVNDLDIAEHEVAITMRGIQPDRITPNGTGD